MIKKTERISYTIIIPNKPIKKGYKIFSINNEGYLYNYV